MGRLVSEEQINLYKGFVEDIREDLGRFVTLHIPGPKRICPNCNYDPVNKKSSGMYSPRNPFPQTITFRGQTITAPIVFTGGICPVCNGTGQVSDETTKIIKCLIRYLKTDQKRYIIQGIEAENDFRLKAAIKFENDFKNARVVEIDGVPCEVTVINRGGLRDLVQVIVFLKRSEWGPGKKTDVSKY